MACHCDSNSIFEDKSESEVSNNVLEFQNTNRMIFVIKKETTWEEEFVPECKCRLFPLKCRIDRFGYS